MTLDADTRVARRAARKRRTWPRVLAAVVAAVVLFALGVAGGRAPGDPAGARRPQTADRDQPPRPPTKPKEKKKRGGGVWGCCGLLVGVDGGGFRFTLWVSLLPAGAAWAARPPFAR